MFYASSSWLHDTTYFKFLLLLPLLSSFHLKKKHVAVHVNFFFCSCLLISFTYSSKYKLIATYDTTDQIRTKERLKRRKRTQYIFAKIHKSASDLLSLWHIHYYSNNNSRMKIIIKRPNIICIICLNILIFKTITQFLSLSPIHFARTKIHAEKAM